MLDDHSRFSIGLVACGNERSDTVYNELVYKGADRARQSQAWPIARAALARRRIGPGLY